MFNPGQILSKIFKNPNQKELEKLKYLVAKINDFESTIRKLPNDHFPKKTQEFKRFNYRAWRIRGTIAPVSMYFRNW